MTAQMPNPRTTRGRLRIAAAATAILLPVAANAETLNQMLGSAYLFSPTLKSARYTLDAVNEQRPQALSGWLPTVTVTGTAYPNRTTQPSLLGPGSRYNQLTGTTLLTLPITQGGGEYARLHGAEHNILATRASLLSTEQTVLYAAVTAYVDVLTDRAIVKAETENLNALRQMLATVTQQVQAGERTIPEETLTRLRVSDAEATLIDGRSQVVQAESRYFQAAGVAPAGLADPVPLAMLPPTLADTRRLVLAGNPTVQASIYTALSARDSVDQAISTLLPTLSFVVSDERYRQNWPSDTKYLNGSYSNTYFGLQLSVPIYQGGSEYAAVRIAKKTALARDKDRDASSLDAVSSAEQAWEARSDATGQVHQYQDTLRIAAQLVEQYRQEVAAGEITVFEALDGYSSRLTAEVSLFSASRNRTLADYAVLLSVGGLTARTLALDVPYYDPAGDYKRTKWRIWGLGVE